jgi:hypothetical protein
MGTKAEKPYSSWSKFSEAGAIKYFYYLGYAGLYEEVLYLESNEAYEHLKIHFGIVYKSYAE